MFLLKNEVEIPFNGLCFFTSVRLFLEVKACDQIQSFKPEYIRVCDAFDNFHFNYQLKIFTNSCIKWLNNKSFYRILLPLLGDTSLNPGPKNNLQPFDSYEWNVSKLKGLQLIHLNINSFLRKTDGLQYIANSSNAAITGISDSKLNESVLQSEIQINNYNQFVETETETV